MAPYGFQQNASKMIGLVGLVGQGTAAGYQAIRDGSMQPSFEVATSCRSHGSQTNVYGDYRDERPARVEAVKAARAIVCRVLSHTATPIRLKRTLLLSKIRSVAISGLEAFILSSRDCEQLDAQIAAAGRIAMAGGACDRDENGMVTSSLSNRQVLRRWRIAPCKTELLVRRHRWYQTWAKFPMDSVAPLTTVFGHVRLEKGSGLPPGVKGYVVQLDSCTPWARQFVEDLKEFASCEQAITLFEQIGNEYLRVFSAHASWFASLDPAILRAATYTVCIPPPGRNTRLIHYTVVLKNTEVRALYLYINNLTLFEIRMELAA
jgi:hypothetical protein